MPARNPLLPLPFPTPKQMRVPYPCGASVFCRMGGNNQSQPALAFAPALSNPKTNAGALPLRRLCFCRMGGNNQSQPALAFAPARSNPKQMRVPYPCGASVFCRMGGNDQSQPTLAFAPAFLGCHSRRESAFAFAVPSAIGRALHSTEAQIRSSSSKSYFY